MRQYLLAVAGIFALLPLVATAQVAPRPNVIVIMTDDMRTDDLSTLPQIQSLIADAGATFRNAYSPFPLCCPARATLLTGQYAHNHGVQSNKAPTGGFSVFDDSRTLATWLDRNYVTGWIGKYFNEYGANGTATYVPPGWDEWNTPDGSVWNYAQTRWNVNGVMKTFNGQYQTDTLGDFAISFINRHVDDAEPFFLVASILAPHTGTPSEPDDPTGFPTPYVSPEYRDSLSTLQLDRNPAFNEDTSDKPLNLSPLSASEVRALTEVNQQRRESLLSAQDVVQRIADVLAATGELNNTYILFFSDNGYTLGEHRIRGGKVLPYEITAKVPLLIRGPGIPPGTVVNQPVGLHDLAPTVLRMTQNVGAQGTFVIDGVNILSMISDPTLRRNRPIVIEGAPPNGELTPDWTFQGIRTPRWKYVERPTGKRELYDLINDPYELQNQAGMASFSTVQAQMRDRLGRYKFCKGSGCQ
jgi:arylsulfatase A-like enzyme